MTTLLPAVVETAVKPKPTKREIIDALATLHIENIKKENLERTAKRDALDEEIEAALKTLVETKVFAKFKVSHHTHMYSGGKPTAGLSVSFETNELTSELRAKIKERQSLESFCVPSIEYARKTITKQMSGYAPHDERVAALLGDAESRKALEKMLKAFDK